MSSIIAMFLQAMTVRLGLAGRRDLAQACRDAYPKWLVFILWIVAEGAIIATDLAEVIGAAIALKLLFGLPLIAGVCLTAFDVLLILFTQGRSFRVIEGIIALLVLLITVCFAVQIGMSNPEAVAVMSGFLPSSGIFTNHDALIIAVGIIGATVMPHNLFLHGSLVLTRHVDLEDSAAVEVAIKCATIDSTVFLSLALFVNAGILIVAAAAFHTNGE